MRPIKTPAFHRLKSATDRLLYLGGVHPRDLHATSPQFKAEKIRDGRILTESEQREAFESLRDPESIQPYVAVFYSGLTDQAGLGAAATLLRGYVEKDSITEFEHVLPEESLPYNAEDRNRIYCVVGVSTTDPSTQSLRRWVRAASGSAIWVVVSGPKLSEWLAEKAGFAPDFLFSFKILAKSSG